MDKILDKLSSYNIFNYLFPGVVFCIIVDTYFAIPLVQESVIVGLFLYYFVGLTISRFGSLILEPSLQRMGVLKFCTYSDFVKASEKDSKIELLSEVNNMYRTILAMIILLALTASYAKCLDIWPQIATAGKYISIAILFMLFLFSYRKQTNYIFKRVSANKES